MMLGNEYHTPSVLRQWFSAPVSSGRGFEFHPCHTATLLGNWCGVSTQHTILGGLDKMASFFHVLSEKRMSPSSPIKMARGMGKPRSSFSHGSYHAP
jgi:hypothetical protein